MEWWYLGPVVLAVIMFLLVGTVFERRIETAWHQFMERRRAQVAAMAAQDQLPSQADPPPVAELPCNACRQAPILNTCAEPVPATEIPVLNHYTEVPSSTVSENMDTTIKTPSKKSLRSRKSSTILSSKSVVVVNTCS